MKATYLLSFLGGAAVMLGMSGLSGSDTTTSTPRLRIAPVPRQRGQNGRTQSALWRSHRRNLQAA